MAGGVFAAWHVLRSSLMARVSRATKVNLATSLSLMLLWTTVAAFGVFMASNHYYAVDARYLTIALFAGFVSAGYVCANQEMAAADGGYLPAPVILVGMALGMAAVPENLSPSYGCFEGRDGAKLNRRASYDSPSG